MSKRAVIYVRVSSEIQSEKVSPEAQEQDARPYCAQRGYQVVTVYRDTEKYRVGRRLVEPSGSRADRPALKKMLFDARAGIFDVIIAWREDRLYRGMRPMLDVLDCLDDTKIDIELVKETFDKRLAPVKAWAAKMELDAKVDRHAMGVAGRLSAGKVWTGGIPYGYRQAIDSDGKPTGKPELEPVESEWVKKIWEWFAEGCPHREIRRQLLEGNAPQRKQAAIRWRTPYIYRLLRNPVYHTGIQTMVWGGKVFEIEFPVIVNEDIARRVDERKANSKAFPARHIKHNYLGLGLVYCQSCNIKMASRTARTWRRKGKPRNYIAREYRCPNYTFGYPSVECVRIIRVNELDAKLWQKVEYVLNEDNETEEWVKIRVEELRQQEGEAEASIDRLRRELGKLDEERQWVITQARKQTITEADMEQQLAVLDAHKTELRRELNDKTLLTGNRAERLIEFINRYRANMQSKLKWLCSSPDGEDEKLAQFRARREIIEMIVRRVNVKKDKSIDVEFEFDLAGLEQIQDSPSKSQ